MSIPCFDTDASDEISPYTATIFEADEIRHTFKFNEEELRVILEKRNAMNKPVVVISVAGATRKGKSFLLNLFLQYIYAKDRNNWLSDKNDLPVPGFEFRGGAERVTTGIMMWSEPVPVKLADDTEAVVLLMDTQGSFDSKSIVKDWVTVFGLSTFISSIQLFAEYGRTACQGGNKCFQKLLFLIRDWQWKEQYSYGAKGGGQFIKNKLQRSNSQHEDHRSVRQTIIDCFSKIQCFLMPHPGLTIGQKKSFNTAVKGLDENFKTYASDFVKATLGDSKNLTIKEINENVVTGADLLDAVKKYAECFEGEKLPEPRSMFEATAETNHRMAVRKALKEYQKKMDEFTTTNSRSQEELEETSKKITKQVIRKYKQAKKLGSDLFEEKFLQKLDKDLDKEFQRCQDKNDSKMSVMEHLTEPLKLLKSAGCTALALHMSPLQKVAEVLHITPVSNGLKSAQSGLSKAAQVKCKGVCRFVAKRMSSIAGWFDWYPTPVEQEQKEEEGEEEDKEKESPHVDNIQTSASKHATNDHEVQKSATKSYTRLLLLGMFVIFFVFITVWTQMVDVYLMILVIVVMIIFFIFHHFKTKSDLQRKKQK